jgi:hypothetical protein
MASVLLNRKGATVGAQVLAIFNSYEAMKAFHVSLVGLWIGADIGTNLSFRRMIDASLPIPTRLAMAKLFAVLDQGPRFALVIMLMLGITMTHNGGWGFDGSYGGPLALAAALIGIVWVAGVAYQHWAAHPPAGTMRTPTQLRMATIYRKVDLYWRIGVTTALVIAAVVSLFSSSGPISAKWLAVKLLGFAGIVAMGAYIRVILPPITSTFGEIVGQGSTPEREARLQVACVPAMRAVWTIWIIIGLLSILAVLKPWM